MNRWALVVGLGLMGCGGEGPRPKGASGGGGPPAHDTSTGADTAPSDTGGADTAGSGPGPVLALRGPAPGAAGATLAVVPMAFGEGPAFGEPLLEVPVGADGGVDLGLPAVAPGPHGGLGRAHPGLQGTLYGLRVRAGDGAEGTAIVAFPLDRALLWVEEPGEGPWPPGWSLVDLGLSGPHQPGRCLLDTSEPLDWREGYPQAAPWAEGVSLVWRAPAVALTLELPAPAAPGAVAQRGAPFVWDGPGDAVDLYALPAAAAALTLTDPPPAASRVGGDPSWVYHLYQPQALDADGGVVGIGCLDGAPVALRWTDPVTDWRGWRLLECYGGSAGWRVVTPDETGAWTRFLAPEALPGLRIDACAAGAATRGAR